MDENACSVRDTIHTAAAIKGLIPPFTTLMLDINTTSRSRIHWNYKTHCSTRISIMDPRNGGSKQFELLRSLRVNGKPGLFWIDGIRDEMLHIMTFWTDGNWNNGFCFVFRIVMTIHPSDFFFLWELFIWLTFDTQYFIFYLMIICGVEQNRS